MKKSLLYMALVAVFLLSGCSSTSDKVVENNKNDTTKSQKYEFIFVCPFVEPEYWGTCIKGMQKADENLGTTTEVLGPKTPDHYMENLVGNMKKAIAQKPDGIITYAGIREMKPLINQAVSEGIPVIAIDSDAPDTSRIAFVGSEEYNLGYEAGEALADISGGNAKVGVLVSSRQAEKEMNVLDAFQDTVEDYDIEIVDVEETSTDVSEAEKTAEKMLQSHPEITAVFGTIGYSTAGAARAKKKMGQKDLRVIGFSDTEENVKFVREGIVDAVFAQKRYSAGLHSVNLLKEYKDTGTLPKDNYNLGAYKVTKENVDTYMNAPDVLNFTNKEVRVGYYSGEVNLQNGFEPDARKSGYAYEYYQEIAKVTGWKYTYVYGTKREILHKLQEGKVDIVAGIHNSDKLGGKVLFSRRDMGLSGISQYFALNPKRKDLLEELDYAMDEIWQNEQHFTSDIYSKYYGGSSGQALNDEEFEWIRKKDVIKIGYVRYNLPLSDQDEQGNPKGIIRELFEYLKKNINTRVEAVCYDNVREMEKALQKKEIDAAFPAYLDVWLTESKNFRQTDAIISDRVMVVYDGIYSSDLMQQVALPQSDIGIQYYLKKIYPDAHMTSYYSREEAMNAVVDGKEKCIVGSADIMQHMMSGNEQYKNLNIAYLDVDENFGMLVREDDCLLLSILNKMTGRIGNTVLTNALIRYSETETSYDIKEFVRRNSIEVAVTLLAFAVFILVMFLLYFRKNHIFNKEQKKAKAELEAALEKANVANEAKTNFLSSMSHDIRTPMNAIVGMATIAQMHMEDGEKVADCLKKIDLSGHHLLTLINNVLDISKIESGQLQLNPVVFSLSDAMTELLNIVQSPLEKKNMQFEYSAPEFKRDMVYADEVRINQIFMNILTNAIKYTPEGGRIALSLTEEESANENMTRLTYTVKDTGMGMSKEFMEHMYDSFTREEDSRINKIQGSGLGLAIVKQMVDMMGGTIECTSEPGKGTQFVIVLDLRLAPADTGQTVETSEKSGDTMLEKERRFWAGKHVLITEDNEMNWEVLTGILEMLDITAEWAKNGEICIEKLRESEPGTYDLVLMDIQMPVMNGRETCLAIRRENREDLKKIPIIAISADAFAEDIKASLEAGMNGHVSKPIDLNVLLQEMKKVLSDKNLEEMS